ncbi:MAG: hypothetical protein AB9866_19730 [Syntrophobacteraceae bacterium]
MRPKITDYSGIIKGLFFFDPGDGIYRDHFPGNPVVPGSMIINAFMLAAETIGGYHRACSISSFRFKKFIPPGEYPYQIEVSGDDLKCSLFEDSLVVATGTLKL